MARSRSAVNVKRSGAALSIVGEGLALAHMDTTAIGATFHYFTRRVLRQGEEALE